ncbi:MAG: hypothetical protein DLM54_07780 [Acidimicrobiales bacterium]|nr:MAG: hypothetical protein DLM54_07780 [Acidimicrobiales bacterium]
MATVSSDVAGDSLAAAGAFLGRGEPALLVADAFLAGFLTAGASVVGAFVVGAFVVGAFVVGAFVVGAFLAVGATSAVGAKSSEGFGLRAVGMEYVPVIG